MKIAELRELIRNEKARSAWTKGVKIYAEELIQDEPFDFDFYASPADKKHLLNGASDWREFSEGGCSLCYDGDIAKRLCNPSELKRTRDGELNPNGHENWIALQSRALYQAEHMILRLERKSRLGRIE